MHEENLPWDVGGKFRIQHLYTEQRLLFTQTDISHVAE